MSIVGLCLFASFTPGLPEIGPEPRVFADAYSQTQMPPLPKSMQPKKRSDWIRGDYVLQGFIGASFYDTLHRTGGTTPDVDGSNEDSSQLPVIGGGAQWKLGGKSIDLGLELMFSLSGRANAAAISTSGGGAVVAVDIDMLLIEVYGGPMANIWIGDSTRVYVGAGPMMEWVNYSQQFEGATTTDDSVGFGTGLYARTGIEFALFNGTMMGLGVRWSDSTIDLGNDLGDLDLDGVQVVLTVTEGF